MKLKDKVVIVTEYNVKTTPQEVLNLATAKRCLKREQQPEDLLGVMMFLASDEGDFITGQTIVVNDGAYFH
ncbi:SDR family oxidoreductase [Chloroflexota bacterium]